VTAGDGHFGSECEIVATKYGVPHRDGGRDRFIVGIRFPAEAEKGNQDRLLPMTPEFSTFLAGVPERERRGRVCRLLNAYGKTLRDGQDDVGKTICQYITAKSYGRSSSQERSPIVAENRTIGDNGVGSKLEVAASG